MKEIIELTKDLIRFKTMHTQTGEIRKCALFIEDYLKKCHAEYRRLDQDGIPSILVMPPGGFAPILLMSHIDVVDGPDELFLPSEQDGKLYGRGSIDDKYAVALSLVLVKQRLRRMREKNRSQDDLSLGILITGDEEIGSTSGAQPALKEIKADFCIALDGGNLEKIVVKEKGILKLKLIARGKTAHGARPWLGENAIENLIADFQTLKKYFEHSTPDRWHRTLNFSSIQAGKSSNQVPDHAEALFDIRYTENDDMDDIIEKIKGEIRGELVVEKKEPLFQGGESPYLDLLLKISPNTRVGFEHGAVSRRWIGGGHCRGTIYRRAGNTVDASHVPHRGRGGKGHSRTPARRYSCRENPVS